MLNRATVVTASLLTLSLAACGDDSANEANVTACEEWVKKTDALKCGDEDFTAYTKPINCTAYADIACNFSEYFDCLLKNSTCREVGTKEKTKVTDTTGWPACWDQVLKKCSSSD